MAVPMVLEKITGPMYWREITGPVYWREIVLSSVVAMVSTSSDHEGPLHDNLTRGSPATEQCETSAPKRYLCRGTECPDQLRARTVPLEKTAIPHRDVPRWGMAHAQRHDATSRVPAQRVRVDRHPALVLR